jgi:hypothetical protein
MKIFSCFSEFFKIFDVFFLPVQMTFKSESYFKTILGGVVSFILYCLFFAVLGYLWADVSNKNEQTITEYKNLAPDPPNFTFSYDMKDVNYTPSNNVSFFFYAMVFINKTTFIPMEKAEVDSILTLTILDNLGSKATGNTTVLHTYSLVNCVDIVPEAVNLYKYPLLSSAFCLNSTMLTVQGDAISYIYHYTSFKISKCSGKKVCLDATSVNNAVNNIAIYFLLSEFNIDANIKDLSPIYYGINKISVGLNPFLYLKFDIYLSQNTFKSYDKVYFPWKGYFEQTIISNSQIVESIKSPSSTLVAFYLRSNYPYSNYVRNYKTFLDFLAQIGGIWKIVFFLGAIIMIPLNSKLMKVALTNEIFNIIPPGKDVEKQSYKYYLNLCPPSDPYKVIKLNNKTPLECKMAIRYYRYERNKGMSFSINEAFSALFFMCFKPNSVKQKDRIFKESERLLLNKLNASTILNFSKQINSLKKVFLGRRAMMVSHSQKHAIYYKKLKFLKKKIEAHIEKYELENIDLALIKEVDFINGIRALKMKIGGLHDRIDINLLRIFNFKPRHLVKYFLQHYSQLEQYFPNLKKHLKDINQPENDEDSEIN